MAIKLLSRWRWCQDRAPELLVLIFIALLPFGEIIHAPVIVLLVVFLLRLVKKEIPWIARLGWYLVACLLLVLPQIFSLLVAIEIHHSIQEITRWSLYMLAGITLVIWFHERIHESLLVYGVAGIVLFWTFDALFQYISGQNLFGYEYNNHRLTGIFHPNMRIGNMLAHCSPFLLEALRRFSMQSSGLSRHWVWLLLLPVLAVILLSGSRSAWLVMLISLPIYALYLIYRGYIRWPMLLYGVVFMASSLAIVVQSSPEMFSRFQVSLGIVSSDFDQLNKASSNRLPIWQDGWDIFKKNPVLGIGKGNLHEHFSELETYRGSRSSHMHLFGLDILVFTGITGFIFYLAFMSILVRIWWEHLKRGHDLAFAAGLALFLMSIPINVHWGFYTLRTSSLLIIFLAVAFGIFSHYAISQKNWKQQA